MTITKIKTSLFVAFLLCTVGTAEAQQLLPLEVGNWWEYNKQDSSEIPDWVMRSEVVSEEIHFAQVYYRLRFINYEPSSGFDPADDELLRSTDTKVYVYDIDSETELIAFQTKVPLGTSWIVKDWGTGKEVNELINILQLPVPATNPSCTFNNVYEFRSYEADASGQRVTEYNYEYIVPGIGIVKEIDNIYASAVTMPTTAELIGNGALSDPVRIARITTSYYTSLQTAYDDANDGDIIQINAIGLCEDLFMDDVVTKTITIEGGYNNNFTSVIGKSVLNGDVNINTGTALIKDMAIN